MDTNHVYISMLQEHSNPSLNKEIEANSITRLNVGCQGTSSTSSSQVFGYRGEILLFCSDQITRKKDAAEAAYNKNSH